MISPQTAGANDGVALAAKVNGRDAYLMVGFQHILSVLVLQTEVLK
jgi:hypothetical protein